MARGGCWGADARGLGLMQLPEGLAGRGVSAAKDVFGEGLEGLEFDGRGRPK